MFDRRSGAAHGSVTPRRSLPNQARGCPVHHAQSSFMADSAAQLSGALHA